MNSFYTKEELNDLGFKCVGDHVLISRKTSIYGADQIEIGSHVRIDDFCILSGKIKLADYIHISAFGVIHGDTVGVEINDFCNVSGKVSFYAASDDYSGEYLTSPVVPEKYKNTHREKIVLNSHVIVGSGCTILPGVMMGEGCAVGAMSLVNKSLNPWTIYAGIPCRERKPRSRRILELEAQMRQELGC